MLYNAPRSYTAGAIRQRNIVKSKITLACNKMKLFFFIATHHDIHAISEIST